MRNAILVTVLLAFGLSVGVIAGEDQKWFDMENCSFCKHLVKDPELLKNMTWEHHDIPKGAVAITTVAPEYKKTYLAAQQAMQDLGMRMQNGEVKPADVKMCGHCMHYGHLMASGATIDYVSGEAAEVTIIWSDTPETVEKIHDYAQRNREELAKWEEEKHEQ